MAQLGIVYVLSNPAMPGLVKIGLTGSEDATLRLIQLYSTGVPLPFKLEYACKVANPEEVEQALHQAFSPNRVNPKREFFQIDPAQAISILKLLHTEDATKEIADSTDTKDPIEIDALKAFESRRPNLNFDEMCIPVGSILVATRDATEVVVTGPRKVRLGDEEMSLTAATRRVLGLPDGTQGVKLGYNWTFNGKSLGRIYDETYTFTL